MIGYQRAPQTNPALACPIRECPAARPGTVHYHLPEATPIVFHAEDCRYLPGTPYLWCTDCEPVMRPLDAAPVEWWHPQGPKTPPDRGWLETECPCCGRPEHVSRWQRLIERLRAPRCVYCGARKTWDFDSVSAQCSRGQYVHVNGANDPHEWNR